ncbi:hypothetical protein D3C77_553780 [compost metagenome]
MYPIFDKIDRLGIGVLNTSMLPDVVSSMPVSNLTSVVFPDPERPSKPKVSAGMTSSEICSSTIFLLNCFEASLTWIRGLLRAMVISPLSN